MPHVHMFQPSPPKKLYDTGTGWAHTSGLNICGNWLPRHDLVISSFFFWLGTNRFATRKPKGNETLFHHHGRSRYVIRRPWWYPKSIWGAAVAHSPHIAPDILLLRQFLPIRLVGGAPQSGLLTLVHRVELVYHSLVKEAVLPSIVGVFIIIITITMTILHWLFVSIPLLEGLSLFRLPTHTQTHTHTPELWSGRHQRCQEEEGGGGDNRRRRGRRRRKTEAF